jgi:hypothetical protein
MKKKRLDVRWVDTTRTSLGGTLPLPGVAVSTETAVHTANRGWTHYTQVKRAPPGENGLSSEPGNTKVILKRL